MNDDIINLNKKQEKILSQSCLYNFGIPGSKKFNQRDCTKLDDSFFEDAFKFTQELESRVLNDIKPIDQKLSEIEQKFADYNKQMKKFIKLKSEGKLSEKEFNEFIKNFSDFKNSN